MLHTLNESFRREHLPGRNIKRTENELIPRIPDKITPDFYLWGFRKDMAGIQGVQGVQ